MCGTDQYIFSFDYFKDHINEKHRNGWRHHEPEVQVTTVAAELGVGIWFREEDKETHR